MILPLPTGPAAHQQIGAGKQDVETIDQVAHAAWESEDSDSDYIHKREQLASLTGRKLHKKRNHVNHFRKTYPGWHYEDICEGNRHNALTIAARWLAERENPGQAEQLEYDSIEFALENRERMGLFGGILYADGKPAAMTIASAVSLDCVDVHFEKAIGPYADHGAFVAVNQCFAASDAASAYDYVNREEDMGMTGLRRAKESYYPICKLKKYYGEIGSLRKGESIQDRVESV